MSRDPDEDEAERRHAAGCASGCLAFLVLAAMTATFIAWSALVGAS